MSQRAMVRCLGPGKEHTFYSVSKVSNRVCPKCSYKLASLNSLAILSDNGKKIVKALSDRGKTL